jgi:enoyl-CoA hydratase/carnithine racemase
VLKAQLNALKEARMTALIKITTEQNVAILTMNTAENRHNPSFIAELNQHLDSIEANGDINAVVLTSSSDKSWSLGIDLQWMASSDNTPTVIADFMNSIGQLFKRIVTFPMPIIAALNGHTYGNGSVLACACDFRFMKSDKGFFCFPEVDVLVPFVPSMFPIINKAINPQFFNRLAMTGERVDAQKLLQQNVVEAIFADEQVLQAGVLEFAQSFNKNRWIYAQNKTQMNKPILDVMAAQDSAFIENISTLLWKKLQQK